MELHDLFLLICHSELESLCKLYTSSGVFFSQVTQENYILGDPFEESLISLANSFSLCITVSVPLLSHRANKEWQIIMQL